MKNCPMKYVVAAAGILLALLTAGNGFGSENAVLTGVVRDLSGKAVEGAAVFVYDTPQTRRAPDFVSARTGQDGRYSMVLLGGQYWAVARQHQGRTGPLPPDSRHSGEPVLVETAPGKDAKQDFTIATIREMATFSRKSRSDHFTLRGAVRAPDKSAVNSVTVVAYRAGSGRDLPDYLSPWTDEQGAFLLYLPAGRYCIGASSDALPSAQVPCAWIEVASSRDGVEIPFPASPVKNGGGAL